VQTYCTNTQTVRLCTVSNTRQGPPQELSNIARQTTGVCQASARPTPTTASLTQLGINTGQQPSVTTSTANPPRSPNNNNGRPSYYTTLHSWQ